MKMTNTLKRALIRDLTKATGCSCHFINDDLGIYYDSVLQFIYIDYTKQKNYTELLENMIAAVELIGCIYSGTQDTLAESSYEEVFYGENILEIAESWSNESLAGCSDCAFQPYCGADPVLNYATQ